ncbi:MAG: cupin domain-containing protein [Thermoplasmatales archaeon]|jgi:hypothetical protein|nr:cupin domain-containing protein [Thermoplasmatales archaeon]
MMAKQEHEFFDVSSIEWTPCEGNVSGLRERILSFDSIEGTATRILKFDPLVDTTPNGIQKHSFWEEVYILEGSIYDKELKKTFSKGMYACRPPGMPHGPWYSAEGCITFEVRYLTRDRQP